MKKIKAIWELMRMEHGFMLIVAILVGAAVSNQNFFRYAISLIFAFLTALFLEVSTFALNDYLDLEIDRRNKRFDRPLVRGDLKPETAMIIFLIFFPAGIAASFMVNIKCFFIASLTGILAILYDFKLKRVKYIGNFYIAYTTAIPFIFGSVAVSEYIPRAVIVLSLIAFIASYGREVMKDIMDMKGDMAAGVKSIPIYLGEKRTCFIISLIYIFSVALSFVPFILLKDTTFYLNPLYLIVVLVADMVFLYISIELLTKKEQPFSKFRNMTLAAMIVGLVAFLVGSFRI